MKIHMVIAMAIIGLGGCASSGPVPIGVDTYLITKQSAGSAFVSAGSIKVEIIQEAQQFCRTQQKEFQIVRTGQESASYGRLPSAEIQFMCLEKGDVELSRPKLRKDADTVIETRHD